MKAPSVSSNLRFRIWGVSYNWCEFTDGCNIEVLAFGSGDRCERNTAMQVGGEPKWSKIGRLGFT